ncbi:anti-sigma factor antagonist [Streptomyces sp. NPDC058375]|uniref:anti-sigma factor antagonist n=1 Tax=Streptomyces sp. NPDC058375 TaxID=3346467 RepID=UPI00364892F4
MRGAPGQSLLILEAVFRDPDFYVLTLRGASCDDEGGVQAAFTRAMLSKLPLIVDLGALHFGDETLLGHLIKALSRCPVLLVGPLSASFQRRLDTTGADALFIVLPTLSDA